MKIWELDGFGLDKLRLADRPEPVPAAGQVLVHLSAWSLNFRDIMVAKGQYNPRLRFPFTPLSDGVGVIASCGSRPLAQRRLPRLAPTPSGRRRPGWGTGGRLYWHRYPPPHVGSRPAPVPGA